jgi:SAM-dependent MidA family methyltransferase
MKLPTPGSSAYVHSNKLIQFIRHEISQADEAISFARFMELVLYAPGLGYYSAGQPKLGKEGDFVTAPEISPLFAQCVAQQCQQVLPELGKKAAILELGAGSGVFAKDLLLELEKLNSLPEHYFILEISAELRHRQEKLLFTHCPHLLPRIVWLNAFPGIAINGIIIANEVLDALPVHCFQIHKTGLKERCVTWQEDHFTWQLRPPTTPELTQRVESLQQNTILPENYKSELRLMLPAWINSLATILEKGIILLFDYGYGETEYYHPARSMGTLMCYYQHYKHDDPFKLIGLQDITAHVDFTSIIESASNAHCALAGYTTQAAFLLACGLLELVKNTSPLAQFQQGQDIKKLIFPAQMGELIKVMAISKNYAKPLCGFPLPDRRRDL